MLLVLAVGCEVGPLDVAGLRCDEERPCGDGFECNAGVCVGQGAAGDAGLDALDAGAGAGDGDGDAGADPDAGTSDAGISLDLDAGVDAGIDVDLDAGLDAGADARSDAGVDAGIPRGVNLLRNPSFESTLVDAGVLAWRVSPGKLVADATVALTGNSSGRMQATAVGQAPVLTPAGDVPGAELGMLVCGSIWVRGETDAGIDLTLVIRERFSDGGIANSSGTRRRVGLQWVQIKEDYATIGNSDLQLRLNSMRIDAGEGAWVDDAWLSVAPSGVCP